MEMGTNRAALNGFGPRQFARRRPARGPVLALAVVIAPLAAAGQAQAACTPAGSASNANVLCAAGTTTINTGQNGDTGYGSSNDNNDKYTIEATAQVTGNRFGIRVGSISSGGTFTNSGTITGTNNDGLQFAGSVDPSFILTNTGTGTITGHNGIGNIAGTLINAGTISTNNSVSGSVLAISGTTFNVTNTGTISAVNPNASDSTAIKADDLTLNNAGLISASAITSSVGLDAFNLLITANTGTINGTTGILLQGNAIINNANNILGIGAAGIGIHTTANSATIDASANSGSIVGAAFGIKADNGITVSNGTGTISGASGATGIGIDAARDVNVTANAGLISGGTVGIQIGGSGTSIINNANRILGNGAAGIGIHTTASSATIDASGNTGSILGGAFGIKANNAITVRNGTGTISGDTAILANTAATVTNAGNILGGVLGITAGTTATVNNSGTISASEVAGAAITANTANVINSGAIQALSFDSHGISALTAANVTNSGVISGFLDAIAADTANVANTGTISSFFTGITARNAIVSNSGLIQGTGPSDGIFATGFANVTNSGVISATVGIQANGTGGVGSTITNSGKIISTAGASGTAIKLSAAADTLNLKIGSQIVGKIDMGLNTADVINVEAATGSRGPGISTLTRSPAGVVDALKAQLVNFQGVINTILVSLGAGGQPSVTVGGVTASLDPTALAQADRTLMDFSAGVSSMVQGRLGSPAGVAGANLQMMSYAMEETPPAGGVSGALGDADNATRMANAAMFAKAPAASWGAAPVTVWSSGFGGQRVQDATDATLRATSSAYGGAIGLDRKVRPDWLVGAFVGGGAGRLSVDLNSQSVDTDYVFGGAYSRFEWGAQFIDMTLQGGSARNKSRRLIANNLTGGLETATASYNGWFISPELAYGYRYQLGNGYVLTPTARLRYVAGLFDGYSETGSAQTLSVASRTLQDVEERGELDLSKVTTFFGGDHTLKTNLHGGVIALQRAGDNTISTVLIGQNLAFTTPGKGSTVGAVVGAGFDYHTSNNVALFGAVEGIAMSDQSRIATAKGGVRVAF
jgi:autotransporter-like protein